MPDAATDRYNKIITAAREQVLEEARAGQIEEVRRLIARALLEVRRQASGRDFSPAKLRRMYNRAFLELQAQIRARIRRQKARAARAEEDAHEEALLAALALLGLSAEGVRTSLTADPAPSQTKAAVGTLVEGHLQEAADTVGAIIAAADGETGPLEDDRRVDLPGTVRQRIESLTSVTSQDVADIAASALAGDQLQRALEEAGMSVGAEGRRLENNMKRLVAHEIASAADEAGKQLAAQSPVVDLVRWTLSSRHHALESSPDACDVLAQADLYGWGPGLYHPSTVPALPHPWCECRIEVTTKRPSQRPTGSEEREVPDRPEDVPVQTIMEETDGERTVTEAHAEAQREMIDRALRMGHENER